MATRGLSLKGKTVAISGFGNVAWGAAKKATELGAKVITLSALMLIVGKQSKYTHYGRSLDSV